MEATKSADCFGLFPGHDIQTSDAEMAYAQAKIATTLRTADGNVVQLETWIRLPHNRWPAHWHGKFKDPVVRLVLALYGHRDAGGCRERHCNEAMVKLGFKAISEWQSCFCHPRLHLMLVIYVDDLKLSGPAGNLKEGWTLIKSKIQIEEPAAASGTKFLGAMHTTYERLVTNGVNPVTGLQKMSTVKASSNAVPSQPTHSAKKVRVRVMEYDMKEFWCPVF